MLIIFCGVGWCFFVDVRFRVIGLMCYFLKFGERGWILSIYLLSLVVGLVFYLWYSEVLVLRLGVLLGLSVFYM